MPEKIGDKEFLNTKEAAKFLRLSEVRIYQLKATDKTFPFHKVGEKLLFEKNELSDWVLKQ